MARKRHFLFETFETSMIGYNRAKSIDATTEWLGDLRGDGYVVSCTTPEHGSSAWSSAGGLVVWVGRRS